MRKYPAELTGLIVAAFSVLTIVTPCTAQSTPPPQKVYAEYEGEIPAGLWDAACPAIPIRHTLEVWNVGEKGGAKYAEAIWTTEQPQGHCSVVDGVGSLKEPSTKTYKGIYSGGPDGEVTFIEAEMSAIKIRFINGKQVKLEYPEALSAYNAVLTVKNPEAFNSVTPTPGPCKPVISNISGLKPGDTLSPSVKYVDMYGDHVDPLSSVMYLNGKQTTSIEWDGKPVKITVQYTCPDHSAAERNLTLPAFKPDGSTPAAQQPDPGVQPAAPETKDQPAVPETSGDLSSGDDSANGVLKTAAIFGGAIGTIGALVTGGIAVSQMVSAGSAATTAAAGSSTAVSTTAVSSGAANPVTPVDTPVQPKPPEPPVDSHPPESNQTQQPEQKKKLTPEERVNLENIRSQMQQQLQEDVAQYNKTSARRANLVIIQKVNLAKIMIKTGISIKQWISLDPIEFATNLSQELVIDRLYNKLFDKNNKMSDAEILVQMKNVMELQKGQMDELRKDVIHLKNEIWNINQRLAGK
jgi:uncharacterized protein YdcH (DUF465 family)